MLPVNPFKKGVCFDFFNTWGTNSMFPFTAKSVVEKENTTGSLKADRLNIKPSRKGNIKE